jgi:lysophospholipase L1-like esterase
MTKENQPRSSWKWFRVSFLMAGVALMLFVFFADKIGFSTSGSFGFGQFLLILFGFVLVLIGWLGRRFTNFYKGAALLIINTVLLFLFVELASWVILSIRDKSFTSTENPRALLPYYASQPWGKDYWREFAVMEKYRYYPWVIWRKRPFEGKYFHINQDGIRQTPGADCVPGAFTIFAFGGSTMIGDGSPDWGTIPAYLQADLAGLGKRPVCTINFGEVGYVSTQEVIELIIQLQKGTVPDLVIFYDGINDVYAAYQSGQACVHTDLGSIASLYNNQDIRPVDQMVKWLQNSSTFQLLNRLTAKLTETKLSVTSYQTMGIASESLANSIAKCYLANNEIVSALAREYGFDYAFFWQPVISIGNKPLTSDEQNMTMDPELVDLLSASYRIVENSAHEKKDLFYIANVFDGQSIEIWNDAMHVTPVGNQLIAQEMMQKLGDQLVGK